ncbi:hypothetical protein ES702_02233 [subsurface metagenome]
MEKNKSEEIKAIRALYYYQGAFKEYREFRKLIDQEAKKRGIDSIELLDYFVDHKEELIKLFKKKDIGKLEKIPGKFKKIYIHPEIDNLMHNLYKTQKLAKIDEGSEAVIWESQGVQYIIKTDYLSKLEGLPPKVFVSQIKNISLLMGFTQEQNFKSKRKRAECKFTLSYYAQRRGYLKEEILRGGKFFIELKRDLFTGAYTTYRIDKVIIEGKEYTAYGIPNFYRLYEPVDPKNKNWIIRFNEPYKAWILQILNGKANQFFIKNRKAIEDRKTTDRPYLFLFYMQLVKRKRKNLLTTPVRIGSLLFDMKLPEKILIRPKECFELLKDCLTYFSQNYQPRPELESFYLYNDFHKTKTAKLPLSISKAFKQYPYEDFKELIKAIGIRDIREAYISFKRPHTKKKHKLNKEENELLERTLNWFDGQVTKIPAGDQESLVKMYIKKIGYGNYRKLFEAEANKIEATAVEFLTRVLPAELKKITYT